MAEHASQKVSNIQSAEQLTKIGEVLLAKMYRLNQVLDYPDTANHVYSEAFWNSNIIPNFPKICVLLSKRFPEHSSKLQLERVDRIALDALRNDGESFLQCLHPHIQLLLDILDFREQALRIIFDISSTIITLQPHQNPVILHAFMDLFCSFVRTNIFSENIPRKMMLQVYNLIHFMLRSNRDCDFYKRLAQFMESYDPPLKGLQEDLKFVSPRIGEVLEAVAAAIFLSTDTKKLRNEGFLSPFHPRYPEILTNSAHPVRAQDLANVTCYRDWVLFGFLVCPDELLRVTSIDIASVVLKENLVVPLFRDEYRLLHEEYQAHVLPRVIESKKMARAGRTKLKENDLEYSVAKQVEKMLSEVNEHAFAYSDATHRERRMLLKQEIGRMVLFFADQPSLLPPNIQMVFSSLALAQCEILWYFEQVGIASANSKSTPTNSVGFDPSDSTIGFLLHGMTNLCCLVRKYMTAVRGYARSYLSASAARIQFLLGCPGIVALELDESLKSLFQNFMRDLVHVPQVGFENASVVSYDLSGLRNAWMEILVSVTSNRSSLSVRHLEKATASTGKEGLIAEGNAVYSWSRCVDELELLLSKNASLKRLYFFHQHLTTVFRNTMFGPEGHPEHCCAWLSVASSFPECASPGIPEELARISRDSILYIESLLKAIVGGLEGLINILISDEGFGSLDTQLLPEKAAAHLNHMSSGQSPRVIQYSLPGRESYPENGDSITTLDAAVQRLTNLSSIMNDAEPISVSNQVFILREYMRECILGTFRKRMRALLSAGDDLQRPSVLELLLNRHMSVVHLVEQHTRMDLTRGIRQILIDETSARSETGETTPLDSLCNRYVDNIVKDSSGAGLLFSPFHRRFKSPDVRFSDSVSDVTELESFVRLFGGYGADLLFRILGDHAVVLVSSIAASLCSNREVLEEASRISEAGERPNLSWDVESAVDLCVQAGEVMAFRELLSEASGRVLEESAPLIHSLVSGTVRHLPPDVRDAEEFRRLRAAAGNAGVQLSDQGSVWLRHILERAGVKGDSRSWSFLPYFLGLFMGSTIWYTTTFNVETRGFTNNIHCLARCVHDLMVANERVRLGDDAAVKFVMEKFIGFACSVILGDETWAGTADRSHVAAKVVFMDQLCEISPYIPRSSLESHIPYALIRSIYGQYYCSGNPLVPLASHSSTSSSSGVLSARSPHRHNSITAASGQVSSGSFGNVESGGRLKHGGISGPLDYGLGHRPKIPESSGSGPGRSGSLHRFTGSRSGPVSYR